VNNYLVFIEAGIIGSILSSYGKANGNGQKTTDLTYSVPRSSTDLSTLDACALSAALSIMYDSFKYSTLSDSTTSSLLTSINNICVSAGLSSCSALNNDRTKCTGAALDTPTTEAEAVVGAVDSAW
jgi:hypothetical protein